MCGRNNSVITKFQAVCPRVVHITVADPGFPVGGHQLPRRLHFEKFVCQNERIWTHGGACQWHPPGSATVSGAYAILYSYALHMHLKLCHTALNSWLQRHTTGSVTVLFTSRNTSNYTLASMLVKNY